MSVLDHFVGLALKGLKEKVFFFRGLRKIIKHFLKVTASRPKLFRQVVNLYSTETTMFLRNIIKILQKFGLTIIISSEVIGVFS